MIFRTDGCGTPREMNTSSAEKPCVRRAANTAPAQRTPADSMAAVTANVAIALFSKNRHLKHFHKLSR